MKTLYVLRDLPLSCITGPEDLNFEVIGSSGLFDPSNISATILAKEYTSKEYYPLENFIDLPVERIEIGKYYLPIPIRDLNPGIGSYQIQWSYLDPNGSTLGEIFNFELVY